MNAASVLASQGSWVFFDPAKIVSSASQPLWHSIPDKEFKQIRLGLSFIMSLMAGVSLYYTNWHNDGYSWYLHNTQILTSTISLWSLLLAAQYPSISYLQTFAKSLF